MGPLRINCWDIAVASAALLAGAILSTLTFGNTTEGVRVVLVEASGRRQFVTGSSGNYSIRAAGILGVSRIEISHSGVRFVDSPCPLGICVAVGAVSSPGDMAICVPNGVALFVEGDEQGEGIDSVTF